MIRHAYLLLEFEPFEWWTELESSPSERAFMGMIVQLFDSIQVSAVQPFPQRGPQNKDSWSRRPHLLTQEQRLKFNHHYKLFWVENRTFYNSKQVLCVVGTKPESTSLEGRHHRHQNHRWRHHRRRSSIIIFSWNDCHHFIVIFIFDDVVIVLSYWLLCSSLNLRDQSINQ